MRRIPLAAVLLLLAALVLPACGSASQPETRPRKAGELALKKVGQFDQPVYVTGAPGFPKLLFVVEQPGRIEVLSGGHSRGAFLDVADQIGYGGERGLLSVAFPPDYPASKRFYVYYTTKAGNIRVDE